MREAIESVRRRLETDRFHRLGAWLANVRDRHNRSVATVCFLKLSES